MTISISWNIDHHSCLAVPQYNKIAVQQGMRAWQLLLDWYTPAERNPVTSCAVALCREVQWVTEKTHNWKKHDYKLTIFPLTFERYISFPFRVGGGFGGGILMVPHHYMPGSSPWPLRYISLPFRARGFGGYPFERYILLPLRVGGVAASILIIPHHYMTMTMMMVMVVMMMIMMMMMGLRVYLVALAVCVSHHVPMMMMVMMMMLLLLMMIMIIASPGKRWRRTVRLLLLVLVMVVIAIINRRNNRTGQYRYP